MRCSRLLTGAGLAAVVMAGVLTAVVPSTGGAGRAAADSSAPPGGLFVPAAGRLLDTRNGTGGYSTPMPAGAVRTVTAAGMAGIPTSGVSAVAVTLTAVGAPSTGSISVTSGDVATPSGSALVFNSGESVSNTALIALHGDGTLHVLSSSPVNLVIDVQGYFSAGPATAPGGFVPVDPTRIGDTRTGLNVPLAQVPNGGSVTLAGAGLAGVPANASAVYVNIAVLGQTVNGYLRTYAADAAVPTTGALGFDNSATAQSVAVPLSADGLFTVLVGAGGPVDLVIDLEGYFTATGSVTAGGGFTPAAVHLLDSRAAPVRTIAGNGLLTVPVAGVGGLPTVADGLAALALNLRTVQPSSTSNASGYVRVWPGDQPEPTTSSLNYTRLDVYRTDLAIVSPAADGTINIRNGGPDPIDVVIDVQGWFGLAAPAVTSTYYLPSQPLTSPADTTAPSFTWTTGDAHVLNFAYGEDGGSPVTVDPSVTSLAWYPTDAGSHTFSVWGVLAGGERTPAASVSFTVASPNTPEPPSYLAASSDRPDGELVSGVLTGTSQQELSAEFYLTDSAGNAIGDTPYATATVATGHRAALAIPSDSLTSGSTYLWSMDTCANGVCSARTPTHSFVAATPAAPDQPSDTSTVIAGTAVTGSNAPISSTACGGAACAPTSDGTLRVGDQGDGTIWRSYLNFDLSSIPAGARITQAVLAFGSATTTGSAAPASISVTPLANAPTSGATGVQLADLAESDGGFTAATTSPSVDLASLVQGWRDGDHPNAGVAVAAAGENAGEGVTFPGPATNGAPTLAVHYLPPAAPSAPRSVATTAGDGTALVLWMPPADDGTSTGIDHYVVTASRSDGSVLASLTTSDQFAVVSGLTDGLSYGMTVQAINSAGSSPVATAAVAPQALAGGAQTWLDSSTAFLAAEDRLRSGAAGSADAALLGVDSAARIAAKLQGEALDLVSQRQLQQAEGHPPASGGAPQLTDTSVWMSGAGQVNVWATVSDTTIGTEGLTSQSSGQLLLTYAADGQLTSVLDGPSALSPFDGNSPANAVITGTDQTSDDDAYALQPDLDTPDNTYDGVKAQLDYRHSVSGNGIANWARVHWKDPNYNSPDDCTAWVSRALHEGGGMAYNYHHQDVYSFYWIPVGPFGPWVRVPYGHAIHDDNAWFNGYGGPQVKQRWAGKNWTYSYNTARDLFTFLTRNPGRFITRTQDVQPGDIVFYKWAVKRGGTQTINHAAVVSYVTDVDIYMAQHSDRHGMRGLWDATSAIKQQDPHPIVFFYRPSGSSR